MEHDKTTQRRQRAVRDTHGDYNEILALLKYCLFNTYVTFCENVYKQFQGIAMGANSAPLITKLFLGAYEQTNGPGGGGRPAYQGRREDLAPDRVPNKYLFSTSARTGYSQWH
jgi:hypothetical protein